MNYSDIINFWFAGLSHEERFSGGEKIDQKIAERFSDLHRAATAGELWNWRVTPEGALAEVIVLDQFSRNLYRGTRKAFEADSQSLSLAQVAIEKGFDQSLPLEQRMFLYMPYMHSESSGIHQEAVKLFEALGNEEALKYEYIHKDIVDRFGRYPHRNEQLHRESSPEEIEYLESTNESFFKS